MGYTHYWTFNSRASKKAYQRALVDCAKIVKESPVLLAGWDSTGGPDLDRQVHFNGCHDAGHEDFWLRSSIGETKGERLPGVESGFNFCKTARKPYDVVVVACLCVLKDCLGRGVRVSSDGGRDDWGDGAHLASRILGREIENPIK